MRNSAQRSGVYNPMLRLPIFLACSFAALAQTAPQRNPMDEAIQSVWQARTARRFEDAAAATEQARSLLKGVPVNHPQFVSWAEQVSQLYQNAGLNAQGRAVLQEALARTSGLGDSNPSRTGLLSALAEAWHQDGNLLLAVNYLEQAAKAEAAAPPSTQAAMPLMRAGVFQSGLVSFSSGRHYVMGYAGGLGNTINTYMRLAGLYQQLGRPDAIAGISAKIRAAASSDPLALARFYEQFGPIEEAAAIYKEQTEQAADPQMRANAWRSLAFLYAGQADYPGAIRATQQAIAAAQAPDPTGVPGQAFWLRQDLANILRQAGQLSQADAVYSQLVADSRGGQQEAQTLNAYAQYLGETERGAQGASLLKNYLAENPNLDPQQQTSALYGLANLSRRMGSSDDAAPYEAAARALQPQPPPPPAGATSIRPDVQKTSAALQKNHLDEAYTLGLRLLDSAGQAVDGQQVQWIIPDIANTLTAYKEPAKAEILFRRLLAVAQDWSAESVQPLIAVTENYARFVMGQPGRASEGPAAIERYRNLLIGANGADSARLAEPLRLQVEAARSHQQWGAASASALELLKFQESVSGNSSTPYLNDLQMAVTVYQSAGDYASALPLLRRSVTIADLLATPNDEWRRVQTRMETAFALARTGQFEAAEALGEEAVRLQHTMRTPGPVVDPQLEEIRRLHRAAVTANAR